MTLDLTSAPHTMPLIRSHGIATLERLLEAGWRIDPPVLKRVAWSPHRATQYAYHFILVRASQRSLVVLDDSPELQQLLAARCITVV
jgi:hypothetical protein